MNYVVFDLEWNQSSDNAKSVKELQFEIVEIGAVLLDSQRVMVSEFSRLVKPQVYHEMHRITSKLIHLQMRELMRGDPFEKVAADFLEWCGEERIFCSWGPLDLSELQNNMKYFGLPDLSDRPIPFLDVQKLFSLAFEDGKSRKSLENAVDILNIEKDIPFHRAFSDAYYTAKVLQQIPEKWLEYVSFDLYHPPVTKEQEVRIVFDNYAKYISRVFPDRAQALEDRAVVGTVCYKCHKNLRKKIRWFTPNGKHFYSVSWCDKHGYMKGKIRIHHGEGDSVYVVKTTRFVDEEVVQDIKNRKEKSRLARKKHRLMKKSEPK